MTAIEAVQAVLLVLNFPILALVLWNAIRWPQPGGRGAVPARSCSVLIPARDEESTIGACVASVLRQGESLLEVIVCDDHSADATAATVRELGRKDGRVRLVAAPALPPDGAANLRVLDPCRRGVGPLALFLDATPGCAPTPWSACSDGGGAEVSFLSCWPGLELVGFWKGC
jgi:cellulose synthase/poly-beta-1,6-N-acetylglucosamine synthase-like glycosyltransferase